MDGGDHQLQVSPAPLSSISSADDNSQSHSSVPAFQEENLKSDEQDDVRQGNSTGYHGGDPTELTEPQTGQVDAAAEGPHEMPGPQARELPEYPDCAVTAAVVTERTSAMLAQEGGGPAASGYGPVAFRATFQVVQALIEGVESTFAAHGEKVLRANCGGILAKDEAYGFAYVDLIHGKLAPRGNGQLCAIPLGEKLRKLNKKRCR